MRTHLSISPRARRWRILAAVASVGVVAAVLTSPGATAASTATAPPATAGSGLPSAAVDLFASQVETLGVKQYPTTFAGATLEPSGVTVVYAVAASDAGLVSAVQALNTQGYPVRVVAVSRSYSQLTAINDKLFRAYSQLQAKGINLAQSGPDPASGTVAVTLQKPTASDMSALASAQGAVTSSNYRDEASAVLEQQAGAGITVQSQYAAGSWVAAARDDDTPAYYDGDQIYRVAADVICTSGFNMVGSAGNAYMITAGHCGSGTWKTHAQTIANTTHNYLTGTSGNDFQTIGIGPGGGSGHVWITDSSVAPVSGALFPEVGDKITFNGSQTKEVRGNYVIATNYDEYHIWNSVGGWYYNASNQVLANNSNGTWICRENDSGGPVYQHTTGTDVKAVGDITAYYSVNGSTGSSECIATQIDHVAFITHTTLITSS